MTSSTMGSRRLAARAAALGLLCACAVAVQAGNLFAQEMIVSDQCDGGCYGEMPYGCYGDCYGGDCYGDDCYGGCFPDCCPTNCQPCASGPVFCAFADYLYLQCTDGDVTHAQQQNGIGGAGTVPFGEIGSIDTDFDSGYRVGAALACGPCSSFVTTFTSFDTDNTETLQPPFIPGGGGAVGSLVHHPGAAITASVGPVNAYYDIEFKTGDLLFRHQVWGNNCYAVNFLVGAQYGHLEQGFIQFGSFGGGNLGAIGTTTNVKFDGGGLKAGFDMKRSLHCGFSIYGRFTAAAMQGKFRGRYDMFNLTTTTQLAYADWEDNRIVPQLEYEAGLSWHSPNGHFMMSTGYMISQWTNTVTTSEFINAVQRDNYVDVGDTLSFGGLVSRVGFCW